MSFYMYMLLDMDMSSDMEVLAPTSDRRGLHRQRSSCPTDERTIAMRYPNHFHENSHRPDTHGGEQHEQGRQPRGFGGAGRDFGHRGGHGMGHGHGCEHQQRHGHPHEAHQGPVQPGGQPGGHPHGGAHRRPTLERSIMKSARRIRRSGLAPEQLHRRIAATVSHADYITTLRTLRRIGMELRSTQPGADAGNPTER